jgi:hypothetical protein
MLRGTCQCEGVEVAVDAVDPVGICCYCSICRKIAGAPFAAVVTTTREAFRVVRGSELLVKYNATPSYDRWHCSRCHASIFGEVTDKTTFPLFVSAAILEPGDIAHVKFDHMFVRSLVPWFHIADDRPRHDTYPG